VLAALNHPNIAQIYGVEHRALVMELRIWMHVSDQDILITRDNYHDWVLANERMAKTLAAKGYPYEFVFAKNACALRPRREGTDPAPDTGVCMAGIRAEEVNRPRGRLLQGRAG
jgi:hypothetical protein